MDVPLYNLLLGGTKDEHFSYFHSSWQLGLMRLQKGCSPITSCLLFCWSEKKEVQMNDATSTEERYSKKVADCQVRVTKKLDASEIFAELTHFFSLQDSRKFSFIVPCVHMWLAYRAFEFFLYYIRHKKNLKA